MAVTLTEKAAEMALKIRQQNECGDAHLRIAVKGGGCGGFEYKFTFDENYDDKTDWRWDWHGVTLVVDKKSSLLLDGTTIDYYEGLERQGFEFNNPNGVKSCGCGSSFQA